jgi:glycosyltransferase involved in cell wall biosynthesis
LVNFSREENLSVSLIEALSAAVPIVALDSGGNSDVVKDGRTGFLLGSPEEASIRLRTLAQNKTQTSIFAAAALEDFKARFSAEKVAKKYLDFYRQD